MRLVVAGGRAQEKTGASGAVAVGVRTLSEGGAVGGFSREQVSKSLLRSVQSRVLFFTSPKNAWHLLPFHFVMEKGED